MSTTNLSPLRQRMIEDMRLRNLAPRTQEAYKLVSNAVIAANDPKVGRAEALRRAMLALIDKGTEQEAHPSFWAPFVVVGEGGSC